MFIFVIYSVLLVFIDLIVKRFAVLNLAHGKIIVLLPNILKLSYVENSGAAFGLFGGLSVLLIIISLAVALFIIYYVNTEKCKSRIQLAGLIFLFAGTVGNLINRLMLGYVIDFIELPYWPTFNLADIFIDVGVFLLIIYIFKSSRVKIK